MATLKISDLSVGDWVINHRGYPTKVQVITSDGNLLCGELDAKSEHCTHLWVQDIKPIPITAEVLEANGFERGTSQFIVYHTDKVWISYDKPSETWSVTMYINDITSNLHANILHIHQLQHALRLAGVDKEINL